MLNKTANKLYRVNNDKALRYTEEARGLANKLGFAKGKAESLRLMGIYYNLKSDYPKAMEYYQKSLNIREDIEDKHGIADCLISIGIILRKNGNYPQALENYQKS